MAKGEKGGEANANNRDVWSSNVQLKKKNKRGSGRKPLVKEREQKE